MLAVKYMQKEALKKGNIEVTRTYKGKGSSGWTGIDNNVINNKLMTIQARFILIYLLSKNESKDYIDQEIIAENCNLSTKQVSRYLVELKQFKHLEIVKSDKPNKKGHYDYKYRLIEDSSVLPVDINHRTYTSSGKKTNKTSVKPSNNNTLEDIKPVDTIGHEPQDIYVPFLYNTIINNTDDNTKKNHHEISDLENVENSLIEFADKADIKKTNDFFDEIIFNSGIFNFAMEDKQIKSFKLKIVPKALKENKLNPVLETIKIFPNYVKKTNEGVNPKGKFSEYEMLTYLGTILLSDCKYPKWFNDLSKQEEVQKQVNSLEDSWKSITNIWKAQGNRIDDSIKIMITNIMEFIQDYEYHKKNDLVYDKKIMLVHFNTSINQTLSKKSALEMMDIIKEYTSRKWLGVDPFKKQIDSFLNDGLTLETIKSYFDSRGIQ